MDEHEGTEEEKPDARRPEYVLYVAVGDLPPAEATAYINKMREAMAPAFGGRSVYIPIRKGDSRIELLQPTSIQKRAWDLYVGTLTKYGDLLSLAKEPETSYYEDPNNISTSNSSPIRKKLAELSFAAAKDFAEVEAKEMKFLSKPCIACGGTGEIEGMRASELDEEEDEE